MKMAYPYHEHGYGIMHPGVGLFPKQSLPLSGFRKVRMRLVGQEEGDFYVLS
jgi:hypothetical protein